MMNGKILIVDDEKNIRLALTAALETLPVQVEAVPVRKYGRADNSAGRVEIVAQPFFDEVRGRAVLLIDDIYDSGESIETLIRVLLDEYRAAEVRAAAAVWRRKNEILQPHFWYLFAYDGPEWLIGYGMDASNVGKQRPDIYRLVN